MSSFLENGFADRRNTAAQAKKALLEKYKASLNSDDPEIARRRAERQAIVEARKAREAARDAAREVARLEAERKAAEEAARLEAERIAAEEKRLAELAAAEANRPNDLIRQAALYAAKRAAGKGRR